MIDLSLRGVKAQYVVMFGVGCFILGLGVYSAYHFFTVELPSGVYTRLPFAVFGCFLLGLILIAQSYPIFIPLKQHSHAETVVCSHCGALVNKAAEFCEKCKQKIEEEAPTSFSGSPHDA